MPRLPNWAGLSDDELRGQTERACGLRIAAHLAALDGQIAGLHQQIADQPNLDVSSKEAPVRAD